MLDDPLYELAATQRHLKGVTVIMRETPKIKNALPENNQRVTSHTQPPLT